MDYKKRALRRKSYADVKAMYDVAKSTKLSLEHQLKTGEGVYDAILLKNNQDHCEKIAYILLKELMERMIKVFPKDF